MFFIRKHYLIVLLPLLPTTASVFGQDIYPADTLVSSNEVSMIGKAFVLPISLWQRFSYNVPFIQCQYYPSCSNYAAGSISEHGVLLGTALASDRIVRCNPFAHHYHLRETPGEFHPDGRIVDPVPALPFAAENNGNKSPLLASAFSTLIPGAGRIYAGRTWDGILGFLTVVLAANVTRVSHQRERRFETAIFGLVTAAFYSGEILGAYRTTAKMR
ncbi:MAG: membrane protein insertion efficiency factor YidD [Candidatus Neomarinimicrobiota bacterium]